MTADAFFVAFKFPNFFRRLFAEGAFNSAFVPLFTERLTREGVEPARRFAANVAAVMVSFMLCFTFVMQLAMPWLMYVIAPGFSDQPDKFALAIELTRLTFPYLMFMALTALLAGMLNSLQQFAAAAAAPIVLNLVLIAALAAGAQRRGYDAGACAGDRRVDRRRRAVPAACLRLPAGRDHAAAAPAAADARRAPGLPPDGPGADRRRRGAGQPGHRRLSRLASAARVGILALLCGPGEPAPARRGRRRRRRRAAAAAVAPSQRRRRSGSGAYAEPRDRIRAAADPAGGRGPARHSGAGGDRAVPARRVRTADAAATDRRAGGLCDRAAGLRADQGADAWLLRRARTPRRRSRSRSFP